MPVNVADPSIYSVDARVDAASEWSDRAQTLTNTQAQKVKQ